MLLQEALRKDPHSTDFLESLQDLLPALAPVFDRAPKYAWIAKQLLEPERAIQFRVVRVDCHGETRRARLCLTVFLPTSYYSSRSISSGRRTITAISGLSETVNASLKVGWVWANTPFCHPLIPGLARR